jgi:hypothetical protein
MKEEYERRRIFEGEREELIFLLRERLENQWLIIMLFSSLVICSACHWLERLGLASEKKICLSM